MMKEGLKQDAVYPGSAPVLYAKTQEIVPEHPEGNRSGRQEPLVVALGRVGPSRSLGRCRDRP